MRGFARLRRHRNDAEYADIDPPEFTEEEAREACEDSGDVVASMRRFIPLVGPFGNRTLPPTRASSARPTEAPSPHLLVAVYHHHHH